MFSSIFGKSKCGFAAGEKQLKMRMKAVYNIGKITKAMKMVAASKMRHDVRRMNEGAQFGVNTVQKIMANEGYLQKKKQAINVKKTLIVPISSDKGLCGGVNSNIIRMVKAVVGLADRNSFKIFSIGEKGTAGLVRSYPDITQNAVTELSTPMNFTLASSIAHQVDLNSQDCQNIVVVYNWFKNSISNETRQLELMSRVEFLKQFKFVTKHDMGEPEGYYQQHYFYELYLASSIHHALLHSIAAEQSSRMNAMENASKNSREMLEKLRLNYNKARQTKITSELCEIISGANAI